MTSVEFLIDKFKNSHANFINWADEYFEEAKELEKQQFIDAYKEGVVDTISRCQYENEEQYYKETYENK